MIPNQRQKRNFANMTLPALFGTIVRKYALMTEHVNMTP
jgi:hypothetical protein